MPTIRTRDARYRRVEVNASDSAAIGTIPRAIACQALIVLTRRGDELRAAAKAAGRYVRSSRPVGRRGSSGRFTAAIGMRRSCSGPSTRGNNPSSPYILVGA
jgi:hypothetical protein